MNKNLKLFLLIGVSILFLVLMFMLDNSGNKKDKKTKTVSENNVNTSVQLEDIEEIATDEELVIKSEQDPTYVSMQMMVPETWAIAMGITDEEESVSENDATVEIVVADNETLGTSADSLFQEAGKNNAIYQIYQIPNNVDETISLCKFSINENVYSVPFSIDSFPLTKVNSTSLQIAAAGDFINSSAYYFSPQRFSLPEYSYADNVAYLSIQVNTVTNMGEAICFDYPHYADDNSYFTCYVGGISLGVKQNQVEQYFGEGYQLSSSEVCYKNDSGIIVVVYEISYFETEYDEKGNEILTEVFYTDKSDIKVKKVYMFENISPIFTFTVDDETEVTEETGEKSEEATEEN